MATTKLGIGGFPATDPGTIGAKEISATVADAQLVEEFDIWRADYAGATVEILIAGTTNRAAVYTDLALTQPATNPQVLLTKTVNNVSYGKFTQSLYTADPYWLSISTNEQTGINRTEIATLQGKNASEALVTTLGGSRARELQQRFGDMIQTLDYGKFLPTSDSSASASQNAATLTSAIGIAAAAGGGFVYVPAGRYAITTIQIPANVVLVGQGKDATIIQSQEANKVVEITGDDAGLANLTLDGVNLVASSYGIFGKDIDRLRLASVKVKRFNTCMEFKGGSDFRWRDVDVDNGVYGVRFRGDADASNGNDGDTFDRLHWFGGTVSTMTDTGVELSVVDLRVAYNTLENVRFTDNVGNQALLIYGAFFTRIINPQFEGNLTNIDVQDNPDTTLTDREVSGLTIEGGYFNSGTNKLDGLCQDVVFDEVRFDSVTTQYNVPTNSILYRDCIEAGTPVNSGDTTKKTTFQTVNRGEVSGATTSATAVVGWKHQLQPGEVALLEVAATAQRQDGEEFAVIKAIHGARCDSADLAYDAQTANFTVGGILTGATSGATATIIADADSGTTGTLSLIRISGTFVDNEIITDDSTGSARVNGTLTYNNAALIGSATSVHSQDSGTTGYAVGFAVSGREVHVTFTGAASETVYWQAEVKMTTSEGA